MSQLLTNGY